MKRLLCVMGWMFAMMLPAEDFTVNGLKVELIGNRVGAQKAVVVLSKSRASVQSDPDQYAPIIPELLKKKWVIVVVDIPGTGEDIREGEKNSEFVHSITETWRKRMDQGENVIEDFSAKLSAVVDRLLLEKIVNPRYLYLYGRGEGGLLALNASFFDSRFKGVALQSPLTDLRVFPHYTTFEGSKAPLTAVLACSAKLKNVVLSDRSIFAVIGPDDRLNDTAAAVTFMSTIRLGADVELKIKPSVMSAPVGAQDLVKYLLEKRK